jgi:hypothetical protein
MYNACYNIPFDHCSSSGVPPLLTPPIATSSSPGSTTSPLRPSSFLFAAPPPPLQTAMTSAAFNPALSNAFLNPLAVAASNRGQQFGGKYYNKMNCGMVLTHIIL